MAAEKGVECGRKWHPFGKSKLSTSKILLIEYLIYLKLLVLLGLVTIITITIPALKLGKKYIKASNLYPYSSHKV